MKFSGSELRINKIEISRTMDFSKGLFNDERMIIWYASCIGAYSLSKEKQEDLRMSMKGDVGM